MWYCWVRVNRRITPVCALFRISGSGSGKSGKTGKLEKSHVTYHFKALGKLVNVVTLEIRISGSRKSSRTGKNHVTYHVEDIGDLVNAVVKRLED